MSWPRHTNFSDSADSSPDLLFLSSFGNCSVNENDWSVQKGHGSSELPRTTEEQAGVLGQEIVVSNLGEAGSRE